MRPYLLPVTVAGLVLLAGCSAPLQTASPGRSDDVSRTVVATGTGSVTADPDLAVLSLAVSSSADSADAAREATATRVDALLTALDDAGVDEENVTTTRFSLAPEYDHRDGTRDVDGYRAVHALRVEVAPADAGRIVDVSVDAAEVEIRNVAFTLSDDRQEELREDAIAGAVDAARSDAEAAADAAGLSIDGVDSVQVGSGPVTYSRVAEASADSAATEFQPGPVTVSATVTVSYRTSE